MAKKIVIKKRPKITPERYKKELNEEQFAVVTHDNGPALVIAGAGSGKTRALTYRVAYLLDNSIPPDSIVLVTFTKKAAQEMINRVETLAGSKIKGVHAGTFHHIANTVLRRYAKKMGIQSNFTILDRADQNQLMKIIIGETINKEEKKRYPKPAELVNIYSKRINLALSLTDTIQQEFSYYTELTDQISSMLDKYDTMKIAGNQMDFDDLLLYLLAFLQDEELSGVFKKKIKHVMVDEYQDVNAVQAKIVDALSTHAESLTVVGDDAQAIYRFRGADFSHMLNFPKNHPNTIKYKLETNYRSVPEILDLANESISHNQNQFEKNLKTSRPSGEKPMVCPCEDVEQEALLICEMVLRYRDQGIPLHEQAVLFRAGFHRIKLEQELIRQNIPYDVRAGVRFFEQAHIKDLMSYLTLISNPADQVQWIRALTMHKGISNVAAQKIIALFSNKGNQLEEFVNLNLDQKLKGKRVLKVGQHNLLNMQKFYLELVFDPSSKKLLPEDKFSSLHEIAQKIIKYIEPMIKENYHQNADDRLRDLQELTIFTRQYSNITAFLSDILTQYDIKGESIKAGQEDDEEKPLILSTIHQAKGLEWNVVFLISLTEGRMPGSRSIGDEEEIEEERRLFYVTCTRAKDHLLLTYPIFVRSFSPSDNISGPSRFITEIEDKDVFETVEIEEE